MTAKAKNMYNWFSEFLAHTNIKDGLGWQTNLCY